MEESQLRFLEKQLMTKFFLFWGKKAIFFLQKMAAPSKKGYSPKYVYGTNVLMYERWLVLKVQYTAYRPNAFAIP